MKISNKLANYLKGTVIDFGEFYILDIIELEQNECVLLLATLPNISMPIAYFVFWYKGEKTGYTTLEKMLCTMIERGFINKAYATELTNNYYNNTKENN